MKKFQDIFEKLKERAGANIKTEEGMVDLGKGSLLREGIDDAHQFRLPYSSDPKPVEDRWK